MQPARAFGRVPAGGPASGLDDHRDDHRPATELAADPAADGAADDLLQLVGVGDPPCGGVGERVLDPGPDLVEDRLVLGEAARVDLRAGDDLAGGRVDARRRRDEPLVAAGSGGPSAAPR